MNGRQRHRETGSRMRIGNELILRLVGQNPRLSLRIELIPTGRPIVTELQIAQSEISQSSQNKDEGSLRMIGLVYFPLYVEVDRIYIIEHPLTASNIDNAVCRAGQGRSIDTRFGRVRKNFFWTMRTESSNTTFFGGLAFLCARFARNTW